MAPLVRRSWAKRGQTPVLVQRGRSRRKVSIIGALAISPKRRRVRAYFGFRPDANYDGATILTFVKALARTRHGPLELIWDRLKAHYGEPMASWLARHRNQVRVHLLPSYAPELNPVEQIWGYAKTNPLANFAPVTLHELLTQTHRATRQIARNPSLLRSFLEHTPLVLRLR
jgi:hypothetical protein